MENMGLVYLFGQYILCGINCCAQQLVLACGRYGLGGLRYRLNHAHAYTNTAWKFLLVVIAHAYLRCHVRDHVHGQARQPTRLVRTSNPLRCLRDRSCCV